MARNAVVHPVLFIAAMITATMFAGVIVTETSLYVQSVDDENDRAIAELEAAVTIINDEVMGAAYDLDTGELTLYVKNVGGSTLEPSAIDIVIRGKLIDPSETRVLDHTHWRPGTVLELTIDEPLAGDDNRAVVRTDRTWASLRSTCRRQ